MSEPLFGVYRMDRDDTPDPNEIHSTEFEFEKVPADEVIRGWDNLQDFLDDNMKTNDVDGRIRRESQYFWREERPETAPERVICSKCGRTTNTRSDERVEYLKHMHHLSTGH